MNNKNKLLNIWVKLNIFTKKQIMKTHCSAHNYLDLVNNYSRKQTTFGHYILTVAIITPLF
jgi:hypothetical protein